MKIARSSLAVLACICLLSGCQSPPAQSRIPATDSQVTRNNCYSLLHQLLDDEKNVSILRFIKRENTDLKSLIKSVSAAAKAGAEQLEVFAKQDPTLILDDYRLPPGEQKTRDAIGATKEKELLHQSGARFELTLLLTQIEALNYGVHLAKVAALNDTQPDRIRYLAGLSEQMKNLEDQVTARLALKTQLSKPPVP